MNKKTGFNIKNKIKGLLALFSIILLSTQALAVLTTVDITGIKNHSGAALPTGKYVQIFETNNATAGTPQSNGMPLNDTLVTSGAINPAGEYHWPPDINQNKYVYVRAWENWTGPTSGNPTSGDYYGQSTPENVGSGFLYNYAPAGFTTSSQFVTAASLTNLSPTSRGQGAQNQTLTINGSGFASGATVNISPSTGITLGTPTITSSQITINISLATNTPTGAKTVTVTNPSQSASNGLTFTVNAGPLATSTSPNSGNPGQTLNVNINGTNFRAGTWTSSNVIFSGTGITVNSVNRTSSSQLVANITIAAGAGTTGRTVTVINPDDAGKLTSTSNIFTVSPAGTITVTSPNGTELWAGGSTHNITWTSTNFTGNVQIQYSTNSGSTWNNIVASTNNDGTYAWTIPSTINSTNCLIKVLNASGGSPSDTSNAVFAIDSTDPSAPTGLAANPSSWTATNSFSINWTNPSDSSGIKGIYYKVGTAPTSDTDGTYTTNKPITVTAPSSGTHTVYIWAVDNAGNTNYQNRASTTIRYDGQVPTLSGSISTPTSPTNSTSLSYSLSGVTINDSLSGPATTNRYYYLFNKSATATKAQVLAGTATDNNTVNVNATSDGIWYLHLVGRDSVGNTSTVMNSTAVTVDTVDPSISSTTPNDSTTGVSINQSIIINFAEAMNTSSVTYTLSPNPGGLSPVWSNGNKRLTISHSNFSYSTPYTFTIDDAEDLAGNSLTGSNSISFTTAAQALPVITVNPTNSKATITQGNNPSPNAITIDISNSGTATLNTWEAGTITYSGAQNNWLTLSKSSGGSIASSANDSFDATVQDVSSYSVGTYTATIPLSFSQGISSQNVTITLEVVAGQLNIITPTLPPVFANDPYAENLEAEGGVKPYTWQQISGTIPGGMQLSTSGSITGTPTTAGTYTFEAQVADSLSSTATKEYTLTVFGESAIELTPFEIFIDILEGQNASQETFQIKNPGTKTLNYTITKPAGTNWVSYSPSSGNILPSASQTITLTFNTSSLTMGNYNGKITVSDSQAINNPQTLEVSVNVGEALNIEPNLPPAQVGQAYAHTIEAFGGFPSYSWSLQSGSLPAGINRTDDYLFGTPTQAGTYNFTMQVTDSQSNTKTQLLTLEVMPVAAALDVSPNSLTYTATTGGSNPAAQNITISNSGGGTLTWTASDNASWLTLGSTSGTAPSTISASVDITGLSSGTYTATISVTSNGGNQSIPVTLSVSSQPPAISVAPASLTYTATAGGSNPNNKTFTISNSGGGALNWTASDNASWLTLGSTSGTATSAVTAAVDITGLTAGTYTATISVTSNGGNQSIPVSLSVAQQPATINISSTSLTYTATTGGSNPAAQNITISNSGGGTLTWTASDNASWLTLGSTSGTAPSTISASVDITGLSSGTYTATISVTSNGGNQSIPVTLSVSSQTPAISVAPVSLTYTATAGGSNPDPQHLTITNNGSGTLTWTASTSASWLAFPPSGTASSTRAAAVDITGLTAGTYNATISISFNGGSQNIPVTLTVSSQSPVMTGSPTSLTFTATQGGSNPANQSLSISNSGGGSLSWSLAENANWLSLTPSSGTGAATISASVDITGLSSGTYTTTIAATSNGGNGSIPVTLILTTSGTQSSTGPTITNITPASPEVGQNITISGTNFGTTGGTVYFKTLLGDVTGTPNSWQDTAIILPVPNTVPTGETTVEVTVGTQSASAIITVLPQSTTPIITEEVRIDSVTPTAAPAGTNITLIGREFGSTQGLSYVLFENTNTNSSHQVAQVISWSATQIHLVVPTEISKGNYTIKVIKRVLSTGNSLAAKESNTQAFMVTASAAGSGLATIYPNPFNPLAAGTTVTIAYNPGSATNIGIYIYDMTARLVKKTIVSGSSATWDGYDENLVLVGDGAYMVRIIDEESKTLIAKGKVLIIKK